MDQRHKPKIGTDTMKLQAIKFDRSNRSLSLLDQLVIPFQEVYIPIYSIADGYGAIKKMQVRGAPAIAIVGALSIAVELNYVIHGGVTQAYYDLNNLANFKKRLTERVNYLVTSRPTAVNLSNVANDILKNIVQADSASSPAELLEQIYAYVVQLYDADLTNNKKIGQHGAEFILNSLQKQCFSGAFSIMTICNTGSLATSGHGTALGIVRLLWEVSKANNSKSTVDTKKLKKDGFGEPEAWLEHVIPLETRPYNQGSRLTAFELVYEGIPATLITDSMVSFLIDSISSGRATGIPPIKYIVVGADRITLSGDTANKIGTLQLARLASLYPDIKFLVAADTTTIDRNIRLGNDIVVEQRPPDELRQVKGLLSGTAEIATVQVAPHNISVWNPSFDVTPHEFIDAIVTQEGVLTKNKGVFDI